jgi:hypothetical protein
VTSSASIALSFLRMSLLDTLDDVLDGVLA